MKECPHCEGSGKIEHVDDKGAREATCEVCRGSGRVADDYGAAAAEPE